MSIPTRLIDADAIQRHFEDMQRYDTCAANFSDHRGEPSTNWYCVEDALANAPTVEAIPVEWFQERMKDRHRHLSEKLKYGGILDEWKREQRG